MKLFGESDVGRADLPLVRDELGLDELGLGVVGCTSKPVSARSLGSADELIQAQIQSIKPGLMGELTESRYHRCGLLPRQGLKPREARALRRDITVMKMGKLRAFLLSRRDSGWRGGDW